MLLLLAQLVAPPLQPGPVRIPEPVPKEQFPSTPVDKVPLDPELLQLPLKAQPSKQKGDRRLLGDQRSKDPLPIAPMNFQIF